MVDRHVHLRDHLIGGAVHEGPGLGDGSKGHDGGGGRVTDVPGRTGHRDGLIGGGRGRPGSGPRREAAVVVEEALRGRRRGRV